ncbi:MAG TPA: hypothetical protein VIL63_03095 [Terriglobales bacterium]
MPYVSPSARPQRAERVNLEEITPVVLRANDGRRCAGTLRVISVTGGLLALSPPLDTGLAVKVMFLTEKGSVLGAAQMLSPVAWDRQPFRFVTICEQDRSRLYSTIQSKLAKIRRELEQRSQERAQMEKFRAW